MKNKQKFEPYYKNLSADEANTTGYFIPKHTEINWKCHATLLCTPINFLKRDTKNPAILISTGAHCPMHEGHIGMMINAKRIVEENGYDVIGGYLSPGHDQYIKEKTGDNYMPIHDRMRWANNLLKEFKQDWLAIDPWEGTFAPGAVNFTSVVYRLQLYINKLFTDKKKPKIFFVCGTDNARFVVPFQNSDIGCVVIKRPNYEAIGDTYSKYKNLDKNVTLFGYGNSVANSTDIRKTKEYKDFKNVKQKQAYVRIHWNFVEKEVFCELKKYFSIVWAEDFDVQKKDYTMFNNHDKKVINLDIETHHGKKLNISRLFDFYGQKNLGFTHRPKTYPLTKQIESMLIKEHFKECYLFDDDIFTGSTMDYVEELLQKYGVSVLGRMSFISGALKDKEVLDTKDFLLGYLDGGLVTKFDIDLIRVPYIYPFVCPSTRASISDPLQFSINMWKINMNFWKDKYTIIDSCPELHYLIKLGYSRYESLYDVSKYYYDFLQNIKAYS